MTAFQVGGFVRPGRAYIRRAADDQLERHLRAGDFCYILAPRQSGKTSLFEAAFRRLQQTDHVTCFAIDLNGIGAEDGPEETFYIELAASFARGAGLLEPNQSAWTPSLAPRQWFWEYLDSTFSKDQTRRTVVLLDEIDRFRVLKNVSGDEFFASLRAFLETRNREGRLTLALAGTVSPRELIANQVRTPFNLGTAIEVDDFTLEQCGAFAEPLATDERLASTAIREAHRYTNGHPFQTVRLLSLFADELEEDAGAGERVAETVADLVRKHFKASIHQDPSLTAAAKYFTQENADALTATMLEDLERLSREGPVRFQPARESHVRLRLTGIVRVVDGPGGVSLAPRNEIFAEVFSREWVAQVLRERALSEGLGRWIRSERSNDLLLRGKVLRDAIAWMENREDVTPEERTFVTESQVAELRSVQTRQRQLAFALVAAVLAGGLLVGLMKTRQDALMAERDASRAQDKARAAAVERQLAMIEKERALEEASKAADVAAAANREAEIAQAKALATEAQAKRAESDRLRAESEAASAKKLTELERQRKVEAQSHVEALKAKQLQLEANAIALENASRDLKNCQADAAQHRPFPATPE